MATGQAGAVLRYLRQFVGRPTALGAEDRDLLKRFTSTRDEAAFAALMHRHGPMVWGVCRRTLTNSTDADDAFQATFLVLVRKAHSIRQPNLLANWLYGVACRTARAARGVAKRRARREEEFVDMPAVQQLEEQTRLELRWTLDEELVRLPEKYRMPIVLCYLEGRTKEEAAQVLGWPHGTVSTRLARAREVLRKRLGRRGLALPATFLSAALAQETLTAAVPTALAETTLKSALLLASSPALAAELISAPVATLTRGVLKAMFLSKLQSAAAVLLILSMLGTGAGVITYQALAGDVPGAGPAAIGFQAAEKHPGGASASAAAPTGDDSSKERSAPGPSSAREVRRALRQPTDDFAKNGIPPAALRDVLELIAARHDLSIRIDYADITRTGETDARGLDERQVELRPTKSIMLSTLLGELLSQAAGDGLTYVVRGNQVVIVPASRLQSAEEGGTSLREKVHVDVDEKPLSEALRELAEAAGANLVLDVRLKDKAKTPVTASLQHVPFETAVRLLADMADLKVVTLDNVLYVTTKENAERWLMEKDGFMPQALGGVGWQVGSGPLGPGVSAPPAPSAGGGGNPASTEKKPEGGGNVK